MITCIIRNIDIPNAFALLDKQLGFCHLRIVSIVRRLHEKQVVFCFSYPVFQHFSILTFHVAIRKNGCKETIIPIHQIIGN